MEYENLLRDYNKAIARIKKAEMFLNDDTVPLEKKLLWIGTEKEKAYNQLVIEISNYMKTYERLTGQPMQSEEIFNGFKTNN